ncbi:hypothetical protein HGM15179_018645 [Zosterops borbonicus]|uniref:Uncharacterized protein n=1 Tax=Zosterops borbonicus TaxID=364589 RepID=A0A8K1DA66_9PASS|nr:hypothetical protein HGM15179_018645 [Zosterops borbonicus]
MLPLNNVLAAASVKFILDFAFDFLGLLIQFGVRWVSQYSWSVTEQGTSPTTGRSSLHVRTASTTISLSDYFVKIPQDPSNPGKGNYCMLDPKSVNI